MPIDRIVKEAAFDPEEVQAIVAAYEAALAKLGLKDRSDPVAEMVAKKIVEIARDGERDPERLSDRVVKSLQG
jgi:DNA-directed RNA polymerase subunit H (RpoH/RPB5)